MLNLTFLCSSLEPGRDGVGDYVRRLAGELICQGHTISAIALNDRHLSNEWVGVQRDENVDIPVFRVPAVWSAKRRFERAIQWINSINPLWLSLQYVPFGFHNKGLPFGLGGYLKVLGQGRKWHVMFHELWVGMDESASMKLVYWGKLQRILIKSMLKQLKPEVIHTQTRLYQLYLRQESFHSNLLPLISNIPVSDHIRRDILFGGIQGKKEVTFIIFGTVHPNAPFKEFVSEVVSLVQYKGLTVSLTVIGRWSAERDKWIAIWKNNNLPVNILGEQFPEQVSEALSKASIGLVSTVYAVIEKSGSAAAMLAHGLPVLCIARSWKPRGIVMDEITYDGIKQYRYGELEQWLSTKQKMPEVVNLTYVGQLFSRSLISETIQHI